MRGARSLFPFAGWLVLALGCIEDRQLDGPWPSESWRVVVVTDQDGRPAAGSPLVLPPGAPLSVALDPPLQIWAWAFPDEAKGGPRLGTCGARLGGGGRPLDRPLGGWSTPLITHRDPEAVVFSPVDPGELARLDLRESCPGGLCENLHVEVWTAPFLDRRLEHVIATADHRAIVASDIDDNGGDFDLWAVDYNVWTPIPGPAELRRSVADLDYDPTRGVVVGLTHSRQNFELDPDSLEIRLTGTTTTGFGEQYVDSDRWLRYGFRGVELIRGRALPAFTAPVQNYAASGRDVALVLNTVGLHASVDGGPFVLERASEPGDGWGRLVADREIAAVSGPLGEFLIRDPQAKVWLPTSPVFASAGVRGLVAAGKERLLVLGEFGFIGLYDHRAGPSAACAYSPAPSVAAFIDGAMAPSGRVAFVITNHLGSVVGDAPLMARVVLP